MKIRTIQYYLLLLVIYSLPAWGQADSAKIHLNGQLVGWTTAQFENPFVLQPGGRFVPTLTGKFAKNDTDVFDFEASLNINGNVTFETGATPVTIGELKPYRIWARYATANFEVRAGLQKINFGQAKLFRPLMWFDGMDVRDPLQLTNGVYAVLGKCYFKNNANIWAWTLLGNESRKGWELFGSDKWKPEVGGRVELPVPKGEIALSTHYRKFEAYNMLSSYWPTTKLLNENRIGLDGKWDIGVGVWFEGSTTITEKNTIFVTRFQDMWNVGLDYTMPIGNGLGATVEYLRYHAGNAFLVEGNSMQLLGAMFNYPLNINDNVSAMLFYIPAQQQFYNYVNWGRTLDKWSFYAIGFWNPENVQLLTIQSGSRNLFSGKGMQVMVSYNF